MQGGREGFFPFVFSNFLGGGSHLACMCLSACGSHVAHMCLRACLQASAVSLPLSTFLPSLRTGTGSLFSSGWLSWSCSCGSARLETQTRPMNVPPCWRLLWPHWFLPDSQCQQHSKHLLHCGETHTAVLVNGPLKTASVRRENTTHEGRRVWHCIFRVLNAVTPNS